MAPFRPSGRSNRSGRSQADHDVFEGLPIKQWRQSEAIVGLPPPVVGEVKPGDNAWPELALPRDHHLLSPWTQALLREARKPRLAKRKEPAEDEKGDEEEDGEKEAETGFLAKKWSHVPANQEEPEREYIAKRRKGLPSLHTSLALQAAVNIPLTAATRKAKVMKADADGKRTIYEVLVPEGQVVEGEIQQDTEMTDAAPERAAPGTIIDGVGIANAEGVIVANDLLQTQPPPRRRNMPPKRVKKGGPGRGKKKVMFSTEGQTGHSTPGGATVPSTPAAGDGGASEPMDIDSARKEEDGEDKDDEDGDDDDDDEEREDGEVSDGEGGPVEVPTAQTGSALATELNEASAPDEAAAALKSENNALEDHAIKQDASPPAHDAPSDRDTSVHVEEAPAPETDAEILEDAPEVDTTMQDPTEAQHDGRSPSELPQATSTHIQEDSQGDPTAVDEEAAVEDEVAPSQNEEPSVEQGTIQEVPEETQEQAPLEVQDDAPAEVQEDIPTEDPQGVTVEGQEEASAEAQEEVASEVHEQVPVEASEEVLTEVQEDVSAEVQEGVSIEVQEEVSAEAQEEGPPKAEEVAPAPAQEEQASAEAQEAQEDVPADASELDPEIASEEPKATRDALSGLEAALGE